jgi:hypothetical protein
MWDESADQYERAMVLWNVVGERDRAVRCVEHWVKCRVLSEEPDLVDNGLADALEGLSETPKGIRSGSYYVRALRNVIFRARSVSLNHLMRGLAVYCKNHHDNDEKKHLESALEAIAAETSRSSSPELLRAAAAGIEQADESVLPVSSLDVLCQHLANSLDHLHYRCTPDDYRTWTMGLGWQRPLVIQVMCMSEDHASLRAGAALALLLRSDGHALEDAVVAVVVARKTASLSIS